MVTTRWLYAVASCRHLVNDSCRYAPVFDNRFFFIRVADQFPKTGLDQATCLVTTHDGDFAAWQPGDAVLMPLLMQYGGVPGKNRKPGR